MRLIDADKLKIRETWALVENVSNTPNGISFAPLFCVLKKDIDDAPTIDAIVNTIEYIRRGEWIQHGGNYDAHSHRMFYSCECSACHMYEDFPQDDETGNVLTSHYCKWCGSNMWKEEQE